VERIVGVNAGRAVASPVTGGRVCVNVGIAAGVPVEIDGNVSVTKISGVGVEGACVAGAQAVTRAVSRVIPMKSLHGMFEFMFRSSSL
jgi:hypothetical protein